MRSKKFLSGIFLLSWFVLFVITGSLEQEYITCGQAFAAGALNYIVMAYSGFRSGLPTLPGGGNCIEHGAKPHAERVLKNT